MEKNIGITDIISKSLSIFLSLLLFLSYFAPYGYGADLDGLYRPLLEGDRFLYETEAYLFDLDDRGVHGGANFDRFDANPYFLTLGKALRFSPIPPVEIELGYNEALHTDYKRSTYNPTGSMTSVQKYNIDYFRNFNSSVRIRMGSSELYFDFLEKRQKANRNSATYPAPPSVFTFIKAHYEDFKGGMRYVSKHLGSEPKSNLSKLKQPLLDDGQINIEANSGYREGKLKRSMSWHIAGTGTYNYNYYHSLKSHLIPQLVLRYGLLNDLELESGLTYTTPFKYKYEYRIFLPNDTSFFLNGTYKLTDNFYIPLKLSYRPRNNIEIGVSSDFHVMNQRLDYWQKNTDETITTFPSKELTYYNSQPSVVLTYLYDDGREIKDDEFSLLTKNLLLKGQWLAECRYIQDITHLSKEPDNRDQNIIDPYNVFLYPLDFFVSGSEYATFLIGNASSPAANIQPQNYLLFKANLTYGLTDNFNLGIGGGYRSNSSLQHFSLPDLRRHSLEFKPYYFIDSLCDWRLTKNSLLSVKAHVVPDYTTIDDRTGDPKEYESKNNYFDIVISLKFLF